MATYNGERFLSAQLESIAAQTSPPHELVICDDGSTDETLAIAEEFARRAPFKVRIERNAERLGYAENFLKAARLSEGELISFSDQDDIWHPEKLERSIRRLADDDCRLAVHNVRFVDAQLDRLPPRRIPRRISRPYMSRPDKFQPWFLIPGMATTFRRRLLELSSGFSRPSAVDDSLDSMPHDEWVYFLATATGKVAFFTDELVFYRQHEANTVGGVDDLAAARWANRRDILVRQSRLAAEYASFLAALGSSRELQASERLAVEASRCFYERTAAWQVGRASIYDSATRHAERFRAALGLARAGAYRQRWCGGFGTRSLVKDVVASALPIARSPVQK
jgi:glycosyltransferase involved in cell wall biosynthesis